MNTPDPIVAYTMRNLRTLACPLCDFTVDVPPVPVAPAVGEALGMSGQTLAAVHAEQVARHTSTQMLGHLQQHAIKEWLAAVVADGVAARDGAP